MAAFKTSWNSSCHGENDLGCNGQQEVCKALKAPVGSVIPALINVDAAFLQPAEGVRLCMAISCQVSTWLKRITWRERTLQEPHIAKMYPHSAPKKGLTVPPWDVTKVEPSILDAAFLKSFASTSKTAHPDARRMTLHGWQLQHCHKPRVAACNRYGNALAGTHGAEPGMVWIALTLLSVQEGKLDWQANPCGSPAKHVKAFELRCSQQVANSVSASKVHRSCTPRSSSSLHGTWICQ